MRYFITFSCYGTQLHGDDSGSVDRRHNVPGSRVLDSDPHRADSNRQRMDQPAYSLHAEARPMVLASIREVCSHGGWNLLAAHVRTNHVHVIVEAEVRPERIMNALKSYASRALNETGRDEPNRKRWSRHGSTRWLFKDQGVRDAIRYVVDEQGEPMSFLSPMGYEPRP